MNHLRELLEDLPKRNVQVLTGWPTEEMPAVALGVAQKTGEQAVCFFMGDIDDVRKLARIPELYRLPFTTCWFEGQIGTSQGQRLITGMLCNEVGGQVQCIGFLRKPSGGWVLLSCANSLDLDVDHLVAEFDNGKSTALLIAYMHASAQSFLSALNCSNVRQQAHAPDAKLQKARAKRGKAPLFSYWTLQLNGRSLRGEDQGGTHASPRVHLRRGHPRQHAPGKWTWVQPHAVGNKARGVVHKDYSAGPALVAPAR